jgi:hypothetical protein
MATLDKIFVHPPDSTLRFPFVKDELESPETMVNALFKEFIEGKQIWNEQQAILTRYYEPYRHIDAISCHFTEDIRVKCISNKKLTFVDGWKSLDPALLKSFKTVDEFRTHLYNTNIYDECNAFSPGLALRLYLGFNDTIAPIKIIDPSAGWGDRMIAAIAAGDYVSEYDGYDPNKDLKKGYQQIIDTLDHKGKCRFFIEPFQTASVPKDYYDLGMTSPPYFDLEEYSSDSTQSVFGVKSYPEWVTKFYSPYLLNLAYAVRPGGKIIIYVSNYKTQDLEYQTKKILSKDCRLIKTGGLKTSDKGRVRPFFVFVKN